MEQKLAALLKLTASVELEVEQERIFLSKVAASDCKNVFDMLNPCTPDSVSSFEVSRFLEKHKIHVEQDEARMIIQYYDLDRKGKWSLETLQKALKPRTIPLNMTTNTKQEDANEIEIHLAKFFERELDIIRKTHTLRIELYKSGGSPTLQLYRAINKRNTDDLNQKDLDIFLLKQGVDLSNSEKVALLQRADRNGKNNITLKEFETYILPDVTRKKVQSKTSELAALNNAGIEEKMPKAKKSQDISISIDTTSHNKNEPKAMQIEALDSSSKPPRGMVPFSSIGLSQKDNMKDLDKKDRLSRDSHQEMKYQSDNYSTFGSPQFSLINDFQVKSDQIPRKYISSIYEKPSINQDEKDKEIKKLQGINPRDSHFTSDELSSNYFSSENKKNNSLIDKKPANSLIEPFETAPPTGSYQGPKDFNEERSFLPVSSSQKRDVFDSPQPKYNLYNSPSNKMFVKAKDIFYIQQQPSQDFETPIFNPSVTKPLTVDTTKSNYSLQEKVPYSLVQSPANQTLRNSLFNPSESAKLKRAGDLFNSNNSSKFIKFSELRRSAHSATAPKAWCAQ